MVLKFIALLFLICSCNFTMAVPPKKFAFLCATGKSWMSYRYQSTLLHAYHTLIKNEFPRDQIITMFYDDIAYHPNNPEPGIIRNHPHGENVYENVKKDYTGENVNAENFIAVLTGNAAKAQGPVIQSGPRDSLFLYIVGEGSSNYLSFPSGEGMTSRELVEVLEKKRRENEIAQIYVNVETPYASTLFDGILSTSNKIFVSTATYQQEFPYAVYCYPERRLCYGSLYGVAWTQHSDRLRHMKSGESQTLFDQFSYVRGNIPFTHVAVFGDMKLGSNKLKEFISYKHEGKKTNTQKLGQANPYHIKSHRKNFDENLSYFACSHRIATEFNDENDKINENRNFVKETMRRIFYRLYSHGYENIFVNKSKNYDHSLLEEELKAYKQVIREFHKYCFDIHENPFVLQEISKFAHLCRQGVAVSDQVRAMMQTCTSEHRNMTNIH